MSYKLLSEDDHSFHILHPDGSDFIVAKKGLSEQALSKIKQATPLHFADGGKVPKLSAENQLLAAEDAKNFGIPDPVSFAESPSLRINNDMPAPGTVPTQVENVSVTDIPSDGNVIPAVDTVDSVREPAAKSPSSSVSSLPGVQEQLTGLKKEADAVGKLGQMNAEVYQRYENDLADLAARTQEQAKMYDDAGRSMFQELVSGKIEPNRIWSNASTGNKVAAAIAIALGGIAGGLNRTNQNVGLDIINKTIEQDIEAQKAEMSKKQNLMALNFEKVRDLRQAEAMTRQQLLAGVQASIDKNANLMSSDVKKAQAMQLSGEVVQKARQSALQNSLGAMLSKNLTPGQKQADEEFGKEYNAWTSGGRARVDKNIERLKAVADYLEAHKNDIVPPSGRFVGRIPDVLRSGTSLNIRDSVEAAMIDGLKETFGGQLSDKEREAKVKTAFNQTLSPAENLPRLRAQIKELEQGKQNKDKKVQHFEGTGTLLGYKSGMGQSEQVRVINPQGKAGVIPASQVKSAISQGYKLVR